MLWSPLIIGLLTSLSSRLCEEDVSLGALGDSFYEYLLKMWIFRGGRNSGDTADRAAYDDAMKAVKEQLVHKSSKGQVYIAEQKNTNQMHKMGHLVRHRLAVSF